MNPGPSLDPVSIAVIIASTLVGKELGAYVGVYIAILIACTGGVLVGVYRRDPTSKLPTWAFVVVAFVFTLGVTTAAAAVLARYLPVDSTLLFFPVAFLVPAIADDWLKIGSWIWSLRRRLSRETPP